jgi:hypothetical protein
VNKTKFLELLNELGFSADNALTFNATDFDGVRTSYVQVWLKDSCVLLAEKVTKSTYTRANAEAIVRANSSNMKG